MALLPSGDETAEGELPGVVRGGRERDGPAAHGRRARRVPPPRCVGAGSSKTCARPARCIRHADCDAAQAGGLAGDPASINRWRRAPLEGFQRCQDDLPGTSRIELPVVHSGRDDLPDGEQVVRNDRVGPDFASRRRRRPITLAAGAQDVQRHDTGFPRAPPAPRRHLRAACAHLRGAARAWSDFRIHGDGYVRILVRDCSCVCRRRSRAAR